MFLRNDDGFFLDIVDARLVLISQKRKDLPFEAVVSYRDASNAKGDNLQTFT